MATSPVPDKPDERAEGTPKIQETEAKSASRTATDIAEMGGTAATTAAAMGRDLAADGGPVRAPSTNLTQDLNNLNFDMLIGGPLQAAVTAEQNLLLSQVDFISKVGFKQPDPSAPRELVMVDFSHMRKDIDAAGKPVEKTVNLRVPLLAMLPTQSLGIDQVIVDFNVKLNSVETSSVSDDLGVNADVKGGFGPVKFKVSASYQRRTSSNVEVKKEYSLNVNVQAGPRENVGLSRVMDMLAA